MVCSRCRRRKSRCASWGNAPRSNDPGGPGGKWGHSTIGCARCRRSGDSAAARG
ncbi:hypothetical protein FHY55_09905 [Oceanicola sp. D3]|nr:hypothetical protein FHY55_09905 [Oceanicola sp. D3]